MSQHGSQCNHLPTAKRLETLYFCLGQVYIDGGKETAPWKVGFGPILLRQERQLQDAFAKHAPDALTFTLGGSATTA